MHDVRWRVCIIDRGSFGYVGINHKNMINRVQESTPSIMVTRKSNDPQNLDKGTSCVWRRCITPNAPYL